MKSLLVIPTANTSTKSQSNAIFLDKECQLNEPVNALDVQQAHKGDVQMIVRCSQCLPKSVTTKD